MHKSFERVEAERCRALADEFLGQPERAFLLRVAKTYDTLVQSVPARVMSAVESHRDYYSRRAKEERDIASDAPSKTAAIHRAIADEYDKLANLPLDAPLKSVQH